jgi:phage shock protein A
MKDKVRHSEAMSQAKAELFKDDVEEQLAALDKQDQIEKMLADMKAKRG